MGDTDISGQNVRQRIKARLIERFRSRPLDSRLPSVRALAAEFDAAYLTVNGVMKELEWEGYVKRLPRKGTFLASRERTVQTDPQTGVARLSTIAFAYPNYFSYATWVRLHHGEEQAVKRRRALVEFKLNPGMKSYNGLRDLVEARGDVCGVIIIPIPGTVSRSEIALFDSLGVPVVLLAPNDFVALGQRVWSVTTDWYRAGYLKAQRLLTAGHQVLAFVQHEPMMSERQTLLLRGMRQAMREAGRRQRDLLVLSAGTRPWDDSRVAAYELTSELLASRKATAAMYESARGAQGALRAAHDRGLSVPDDLAIISTGLGNDDEAYFHPPIDTVDPRADAEMDVAFRCLLDPDRHEARRQTIEPVMHVRQSVIKPSASVPHDTSSECSRVVSCQV
jgi:DNA-binding LacI/PurR family transcriptional regulator